MQISDDTVFRQNYLFSVFYGSLLTCVYFKGSSSVGSVNPQFLAAFSAAAGKRSLPFFESEESDPDVTQC